MQSFSQWNSNPAINTPVCVAPYTQKSIDMVTDTKGGAIIAWSDSRADTNNPNIYVQRMNSAGIPLWTANGITLFPNSFKQSSLASTADGSGGAIIVWDDWRNGNKDVFAQKIDSGGNIKWTASGVPVCVKPLHQANPKGVPDGAGGEIIVWMDSVSGTPKGSYDIYAQRISSTGALMWAAGGVPICIASGIQSYPKIAIDGAGGAFIVWQDKRNGVDYDIYAQHMNASGVAQWAANGIFICSTIGNQKNAKVKSDWAGGAVVVWQDKRGGLGYDVYAQRVNVAGVTQWAVNGVVVCSADSSQSGLDMATDTSGVYFAWQDKRNTNWDIYGQRMNYNGTMAWAANGIPVSIAPLTQATPSIIRDGNGNSIIVWQDSSGGIGDIKSQKIGGNGNALWAAGGMAVGIAAGDQQSPGIISDGSGGCIYVFQDKRNMTDYDVYAHHLNADGTAVNGINEENVFIESKSWPNPFSSSAIIEMQVPAMRGVMQFFLYDMVGKKIEIPFSVSRNEIYIFRGNLQSGIYFYEIKMTDNATSKGKLILTDTY